MAKSPPPLNLGQLELVRPPAPGKLELVRSFLNTLDVQKDVDTIETPMGLVAWLRENDLVERKTKVVASAADVKRVQRVREDIRALARRNNGIDCECRTADLEDASRRSAYRLELDPATGTCALRSSELGIDGALGSILAAVHAATLERTWSRLKACADETCRWAYFDHSKNGCSRWCSPDTCGNRSKVKRYRERHATGLA